MATKHSTSIELLNAHREYAAAQQECPHWVYQTDGLGMHDCCDVMLSAYEHLRKAKKAFREQEKGEQ